MQHICQLFLNNVGSMVLAMTDPRIEDIERRLVASGKSIRWLAEQVGSSDTTVGHILSGQTRNPRDTTIVDRMITALEGVPTAAQSIRVAKRMLRPIPVASTIMAGPPSMNMADVEYEEVPEWGAEFDRWGRTIEGESMLPLFKPGDIAVFENRRVENGYVVHAFRDGEDCIKVFKLIDGLPRLQSFNPDGPDFPADGWISKGVCVARIRYKKYRVREYVEFPSGLSWAMRDIDETG